MATKIIGGLDEAGRGPAIGPMVICGVSFFLDHLDILRTAGVKDSKLLTPEKRIQLASIIENHAKQIVIRTVPAADIDAFRNQGVTLNELEFRLFEEVLSVLESDIIYIDCPDVKPTRLCQRLQGSNRQLTELIVEHKADKQYVACAAASILAKVRRDSIMETIAQQYGKVGSGYLTDPITQEFLKTWINSHNEFPAIVRSTWEPCKRMIEDKKASRLTEFLTNE